MAYLRGRRLMALMLGHLTVDMYTGLIPVLYPLMIARYHVSFQEVGLLTLAFSGVAAVSQPLFGWIADRTTARWTGWTLAWCAGWFAALGFAPTFPVLLACAAIAGLGSGAFHPLGAVNAAEQVPPERRNTGMSVYVTSGTVGLAVGPIVGALTYQFLGLRGTAALTVPGMIFAAILLRELAGSRGRAAAAATAAARAAAARFPIPIRPLAVVIGVMSLRASTLTALTAFTPTWYRQLGYPPAFYGSLATVLVLASAVGAVSWGRLADRVGRRTVILVSVALTIPALLLFTSITGPSAFVSAALVGLLSAATPPLTLLYAQQLMAGRAGLASGLILGTAFVIAALGVPVVGAIGDHVGIQRALQLQVAVVVLTLAVSFLLPGERWMHRLERSRRAPAEVGGAPSTP